MKRCIYCRTEKGLRELALGDETTWVCSDACEERTRAWVTSAEKNMPNVVVQNWRGATTRDRALAAQRDCLVSAGYYLDLMFPADVHYLYDPQAPQAALIDLENGMRGDVRLQHIAGGLAWTDQWRDGAIELDPGQSACGEVLGGEACLWFLFGVVWVSSHYSPLSIHI